MPFVRPDFLDLDLQILLSGNIPSAKVIGGEIVSLTGGAVTLTPPNEVLGAFISIHPRYPSGAAGAYCELRFPDLQGNMQVLYLGGSDKLFFLGNLDFFSQMEIEGFNFAITENASVIYF